MALFRAAVLIVAFALGSLASAQDYSVRLKHRTNMRDAPRLSGKILRTAPVGAVLPVIGKANRWLKVNNSGTTAWIAAWLDYTRVEGGPAATTGQRSQVDNCCFVDRLCRSDEEWKSGYYAYRNNQCAAPAQPQTQPSALPATRSASQVDNCCFVDRQCRNDEEWTNGYYAYQNGQCRSGAPPAASMQLTGLWGPSARTLSRPIIEGSEWFVYGLNSTLDLMQRSAPEWYNFVLNAADKIVEVFTEPTPSSPHANNLNWAQGATRTIGVGADLSCYVGRLCRVAVAEILAHEACHIHEHYMGSLVYPQYATTDPHGSPQLAARNASASIRAGRGRSVT